ncbi:MAG: RecQ family ATP-dependent DNA helicase [Fimbriimonadales bacterium]|nr:RecQ family ATP-dependent DNA helicase [Fimbriimonadales bacterium]
MRQRKEEAKEILRQAVGPEAEFRDGQWDAIEWVLNPGARLLVVQKTGWGKSVVYFVATRLLRDRGPALIISPLLALMRNQIELAARFGLRAASINSTNKGEWPHLVASVLNNGLDVLLVSPERLKDPAFREELLPYLENHISLLVIDEAHCISDWGHDFRPDYRRILSTVQRLKPEAAILGTTATANNRVIADIESQLGDGLKIIRGPLMRESLKLSVFQMRDQAERLAWLAKYLPKFPGTGIVYTLTVNDANRVAAWLREQNIAAKAYHADQENETRQDLETEFRDNKVKALVATTALGMGYNKPDVGFVVHFQRPGSVISYYQQVGRAGREMKTAYCVLLEGGEDEEITSWFIDQAFPVAQVFEAVRRELAKGARTIGELLSLLNFRRRKIEQAVELMDVEGAIRPVAGGWELVNPDWIYDWERSHEITMQRYEELAQMKAYGQHEGCRMEFLAKALDDPLASACGKCDNCKPHAAISIPRDLVIAAQKFLKSDYHPISPRRMLPKELHGRKKLTDDQKLLPGAALCVYNDAGWGVLVRDGKYHSKHYSDELVIPSANVIRSFAHLPDWVTWVPSSDSMHSQMMEDFARRLASELGIECQLAVRKITANRPQKEMQNSERQLTNVWGAFETVADIPDGVCLLVDDIVDSGWTLTAIGLKLCEAGAKGVIPFALATARPRDANG